MSLPDTIVELAPLLRNRAISPIEITRQCLRRIEKLNPSLNAFITVMTESALEQARDAENEIAQGKWRGPLHGVPVSLKDLIDVAGVRTTAASALFKDRIAGEDAEIVRRLKEAGAVIIGKNNLHECAYGGSSMISCWGEIHNPWDLGRIAGGSSGGSAASLAAGLCYGAIGTDTAGSIREPAALCGCVGIKPTYGRVSMRGVIPLSRSLDHVGPLAATVADVAVLLEVSAGYDAADITTPDVPVANYASALRKSPKTLRVGVPRAHFYEDLDTEVASAVEHALATIATLVAEVKDVTLDVPTDRNLQLAEAYAYHAENVARTPELYLPETLRRIRAGADISAREYIGHRHALDEARRNIANVFAEVDLLVTPTMPMPAPLIDELKKNPDDLRPAELKLLRNTRPFNVWGLPSISVPCGFTESGLPIGLQIAGSHWREDLVLRLAYAYEQATEWHRRRPPVA